MEFVEIEHEGKTFKGQYDVDGGIVTVYGHKHTRIQDDDASGHLAQAETLLRLLAKDGDIDPEPD